MPLDSQRVDRIHTRLLARFGSRWTAMWANVEPALVKADWAYVLDKVPDSAIAYALDHLEEEFPPTAGFFRNLCLKGMKDERPALEYAREPVDPSVLAELKRVADLRADRKPREWAYELQQREKAGERLTLAQRHAWRRALETAPAEAGQFTPIPEDSLPPAMRTA